MNALRQALLKVLNQEGRGLLTVNALMQAEQIEQALTQRVADYHTEPAEGLILKFLVVKGVAIAILPFLFLDLFSCILLDLFLIGALVKHYRFPTSRYQVDQIWRQLFLNSGSILLTEIASGILFGLGGNAAVFDNAGGSLPLVGGAIAQAAVAAYGAQRIGQATQTYLIEGATWGPLGPSTLIYQMLQAVKPDMLLYRMRQNLTPLSIKAAAPD